MERLDKILASQGTLSRRDVKEIIKQNGLKDILDIGTGSGCIACTIAQQADTYVLGVDISSEALQIALENASSLNLNNKAVFRKSDIYSKIRECEKFDLIISNPPYIDINENIDDLVKKHEPHLALYSEEKGLYHYNQILIQSKSNLKDNGFIIFEIPSNRDDEIITLVNKYYKDYKIVKDYNNLSRVLIIRS